MTGIYIWAVIIFAASLAALAWPLFRSRSAGDNTSAQDEGLLLLRDRLLVQLENVERDQSDGTMDEAIAKSEIARIEIELAQVLDKLESASAPSADTATMTVSAKFMLPVLVLVLISGAVLYGTAYMQPITHDDIKAHAANENPHANMQGGGLPPQVMEMVKRLEEKLKANPDNLDGWKRLARSYQVMGQTAGAYKALEQAYRLAPDDIEVLAQFAAVSFAMAQGNTQGKAAELFDRLLKLDPNNPSGLWFKGMAAFQKADYKQAISYWEKTKAQLPANSPGRKQVQQGIDEARKRQNAS